MRAGDVVAGRFTLEVLAGVGGMASVYRAHDGVSGEIVALKLLRDGGEQAALRFVREARILAELRHPGIVRYVAHGVAEGGQLYLAMEWLAGESVEQRLRRGRLAVPDAVALAERAADALGVAHARGVVHRDVKPGNLFLPDGQLERLKVLDFGIARWRGHEGRPTRAGLLLGTPGYISPEQAKGRADLDARADVFSLGAVLFECLTGEPAFGGEQPMAILAKILLEDAPRAADHDRSVPAALDALVSRMMAKDPEHRPRDGRAVASELAVCGARSSMPPPRPSAPGARAVQLTAGEQRLLCVVLATGVDDAIPSTSELPDATAATVAAEIASPVDALRADITALGGVLEVLADRSVVVTLGGTRGARDQAAQAARCALAIRAFAPSSPIALATGRGIVGARFPVGEVIERASRQLGAAPGIRIDDVTAGLLDARFAVATRGASLELTAERDAQDAARTLLGKPTACVGREGEIGRLFGAFEACVAEERACAVLMTGAAGQGKSRIREEVLRRIRQGARRAEIWIGRGDPLSAGSPFAMIAPALRRAAGILEGEPLPARSEKLRARVSRHVAASDAPRVATFLGELVGAPSGDDADVQLRAARADAMLMGDQMRRAFEDFLSAECRDHPMVLVLEDLHWGDLPSVKFLDAALRNLVELPLFVLALARPEVLEIFPGLWAERELSQMSLGAIGKKASARLVREVLGAGVPDATVDAIVERSAGNPFYLEELLRAHAEGKGSALPGTVLAMVQARLERLEGEARRVLRAASVFGRSFWRGGVHALLGIDARSPADEAAAEDAGAWLSALVDREIVAMRGEAKFAREDEFVFRHALVHEAAYAMLTDEDRALGHRLAGEWLEGAGEADANVLAEHFERGGERSRAVTWYRRAAEQALEGNDVAAALARAGRGITCGATGATRGALRLLMAEAHGWRGENVEAQCAALDAMGSLPDGTDEWAAAVGQAAGSSGRLGDVERLGALASELRARAPAGGVSPALAVAWLRTAQSAMVIGQPAAARPLFDELPRLDSAAAFREPSVLAWVHRARAIEAYFAHDTSTYLDESMLAVACYDAVGDLRGASLQRVSIGYGYLELGCAAEAEQALRAALEVAQRFGITMVAANARHNLGPALARQGALAEAIEVERRAADECRAQGDRRLEGGSRMYLAEILMRAGLLAEAEIEARAALELLAIVPSIRVRAVAALAAVHLARGDVAAALAEAREAMRYVASGAEVDSGETFVRLVHAEALAKSGDQGAARAALGDARARVLAEAARVGDGARRRTFLELVPENARVMELAVAWDVA